MNSMRILLWRTLALLALATAMLGVILPGLPTVEFLLLSAWAAGRGWPALERWLLAHPRFGPPIRRWREYGAISRHAKWMATVSMSIGVILILISSLPHWAKGLKIRKAHLQRHKVCPCAWFNVTKDINRLRKSVNNFKKI